MKPSQSLSALLALSLICTSCATQVAPSVSQPVEPSQSNNESDEIIPLTMSREEQARNIEAILAEYAAKKLDYDKLQSDLEDVKVNNDGSVGFTFDQLLSILIGIGGVVDTTHSILNLNKAARANFLAGMNYFDASTEARQQSNKASRVMWESAWLSSEVKATHQIQAEIKAAEALIQSEFKSALEVAVTKSEQEGSKVIADAEKRIEEIRTRLDQKIADLRKPTRTTMKLEAMYHFQAKIKEAQESLRTMEGAERARKILAHAWAQHVDDLTHFAKQEIMSKDISNKKKVRKLMLIEQYMPKLVAVLDATHDSKVDPKKMSHILALREKVARSLLGAKGDSAIEVLKTDTRVKAVMASTIKSQMDMDKLRSDVADKLKLKSGLTVKQAMENEMAFDEAEISRRNAEIESLKKRWQEANEANRAAIKEVKRVREELRLAQEDLANARDEQAKRHSKERLEKIAALEKEASTKLASTKAAIESRFEKYRNLYLDSKRPDLAKAIQEYERVQYSKIKPQATAYMDAKAAERKWAIRSGIGAVVTTAALAYLWSGGLVSDNVDEFKITDAELEILKGNLWQAQEDLNLLLEKIESFCAEHGFTADELIAAGKIPAEFLGEVSQEIIEETQINSFVQ